MVCTILPPLSDSGPAELWDMLEAEVLQESYACGPGGIFMRVTKFPPVMEKGLFRMTEPTLHTQLSHQRQADFHNIFHFYSISQILPELFQSF